MKHLPKTSCVRLRKYFQNNGTGRIYCNEYTVTPPNNGIYFKFVITLLLFFFIINNLYVIILEGQVTKFDLCLLLFLVLIFLLCFINLYTTILKECMLVVVPLTIQICTTYYFGNQCTQTFSWEVISDLMITEVIMRQQVKYFLALSLKPKKNEELIANEDVNIPKHVILFRNSRLKLDDLVLIYEDVQKIIDSS